MLHERHSPVAILSGMLHCRHAESRHHSTHAEIKSLLVRHFGPLTIETCQRRYGVNTGITGVGGLGHHILQHFQITLCECVQVHTVFQSPTLCGLLLSGPLLLCSVHEF